MKHCKSNYPILYTKKDPPQPTKVVKCYLAYTLMYQ